MNRFYRFGSLVTIFLLVFSLCSGCAVTQPTAPEATPTSAPSILSLTLWDSQVDTMPAIQNDVISAEITKATGVEWKTLEGNNGLSTTERFNLMVSSGSLPDVLWVTNATPNIWSQCKENDLMWSLTMDDFTKSAPEIAKRLDPVVVAATVLPDGSFYGVPSWMPLSDYDKAQNPNFGAATNDWQSWTGDYNTNYVRDDILKTIFPDALDFNQLYEASKKTGGLTKEDILIPGLQTSDEIIAFLQKVKDLNLTQDGKTILPFAADGDFFKGTMCNSGGVHGNDWGIDFFNNNTKTYDLFYATDAYKAILKSWNGAARAGLLDPNYIVMKNEQKIEKMKLGEYAYIDTLLLSGNDLNDACASFDRSYRYRPVLIPYQLTENFPGFWGCSANAAAFYMLNKKTIKEADIPKVLNFFNYYLTPEGAEMVSYGPESAGLWELDAKGNKVFKTQELKDSAINWTYVDGAKDTAYYGLVDGGPKNAYDARHYIFYMAQNNLSIPRLKAWPLAMTGTEADVYTQVGTVDRKTQQWQIDAIWQGVVNKPEIDSAAVTFTPARGKVLNEVLPAIIFAKDDADFEKYYSIGLDTFNIEGDFAAYKAAMEKGSNDFLTAHPEIAPIAWPVK